MLLFKRNIFVIGTFSLSQLIPEFHWFSWESHWGLLIMIHGASSLFIWRLVDVRWFSNTDKRCLFSRGTFLSLELSLYLSSFLSYIDSRERAIGDNLIMIHGPSSLFIWQLVDVRWFFCIDKRCVLSRGTSLSLEPSLYLTSFLSYIDSRERAIGDFLIMIHGPSSLFIWQLVDVRWFFCIVKRCVLSRGTSLSLEPSLYLTSFLSYIDSRERAIGDFLIMIHGPSSLFIWRLVDVRWFFCIDKRCVLSRGTSLSLEPSIYLSSFLSYIDSRERAIGDNLIMIHGPSSLFIRRLVDVRWFSCIYKRCVLSRGTSLSLEPSLYLTSFLSYIDSRERAIGDFFIMIHGPSSLFLWRLVDVRWFHVYIKDASFLEEHSCDWKLLYISPHSWVTLILVREPLGTFWLWSMVLLAYLSDDSLM